MQALIAGCIISEAMPGISSHPERRIIKPYFSCQVRMKKPPRRRPPHKKSSTYAISGENLCGNGPARSAGCPILGAGTNYM